MMPLNLYDFGDNTVYQCMNESALEALQNVHRMHKSFIVKSTCQLKMAKARLETNEISSAI